MVKYTYLLLTYLLGLSKWNEKTMVSKSFITQTKQRKKERACNQKKRHCFSDAKFVILPFKFLPVQNLIYLFLVEMSTKRELTITTLVQKSNIISKVEKNV